MTQKYTYGYLCKDSFIQRITKDSHEFYDCWYWNKWAIEARPQDLEFTVPDTCILLLGAPL